MLTPESVRLPRCCYGSAAFYCMQCECKDLQAAVKLLPIKKAIKVRLYEKPAQRSKKCVRRSGS